MRRSLKSSNVLKSLTLSSVIGWWAIPTLMVAVSGCGGSGQSGPAASEGIEALPVLTAAQQQLYNQSCKNCHENKAVAAPQKGDLAAWQARAAQGMPVLLQHAVAGFNTMPAGGLCTTCSAEDYSQLIRYLNTAAAKP